MATVIPIAMVIATIVTGSTGIVRVAAVPTGVIAGAMVTGINTAIVGTVGIELESSYG